MSDMLNYLLERSEKKLVGVHAGVAEKAIELINLAYKQGINIAVTQGLRTFAEQDALYAQGRTKAGKKVTNAKGGQSIHNYGLAFDIAVFDDNKNPVWSGNGYNIVGKLGQQMGLEWGGAWKSFKDMPHFEYTFGLTLRQLQQGQRPSGSGTITSGYAPSTPKSYMEKGDSGTNIKGLQGKLQAIGINIGKDGIDGYYGADTERAVREFQKKYKLVADGVAGKDTMAKLTKVYEELNKPKVEDKPKVETKPEVKPKEDETPLAQSGDSKLQEALNMKMCEAVGEYQMKQLETIYREAREDKLLEDERWEKKVADKTITVGEVAFLSSILTHRLKRDHVIKK
ncbi:hypothetical protein BEH_07130 [Priestia filamentosa]|uniref:Uncharacterized protein n=1 Tax=Priestia filamentosa TaxID=1402861 RepID=A0A2S1LZA9_9BACI|nr:peptidoglycan-binding protein [Priestia filamentosa]AWG44153.1 hypothetical protein BEH_07130 [Priestia filamentosa]